jgi:hypothetical protein
VRAIYAQPEIEGAVVRYVSTFFQMESRVYWVFTQLATVPSTGEPASVDQAIRLDLYEEAVTNFAVLPSRPQQKVLRLSTLPVELQDGEALGNTKSPDATFVWPSTGYIGYIYGRDGHNAVDIWTNTSGTGNVGSKGNPIYAVAGGAVHRIFSDSSGVNMVVGVEHASLGLWTWYWHMADEYSSESYITPGLYIGQPVSADTLLGHQGNRRWEGLYDIIVHLHFGVSDVNRSENQFGIDPSPYFSLALNWNDPNHVGWMHYMEHPSTCCGCLPASCCFGAATQTTGSYSEFIWGDSGISSTAKPRLCTAFGTCETADTPEPTSLAEGEKEVDTTEGLVSWNAGLPITTTARVTEPTEVFRKGTDPIDSPAISSVPALRTSVEPQRTPPASTNYRIPKSVFGSGGGQKTSTHFVMNTTQGQSTDLSRRTSASYVLVPGYWGAWSPRIFDHKVYLPLIVRSH